VRGIVPVGVRKMKKRDKKEREWKERGENERGNTTEEINRNENKKRWNEKCRCTNAFLRWFKKKNVWRGLRRNT
jgi:hypothetical protein